ncbi:Uncharacterized protein APZ42_034230 [Daphnia magna]|uniref:Reverse transcriptase/retrotransposon-derived protein RNase H-like domain-containing protein n=1 Tax=Daphnia magna TaxID=35525 RepID=A0A164KBE4_9CRUS|nr:Uncharacterized protein APZ42_034230 [Daphnia magna]
MVLGTLKEITLAGEGTDNEWQVVVLAALETPKWSLEEFRRYASKEIGVERHNTIVGVLQESEYCLAWDSDKLGVCNIPEHPIETGDCRPIRQSPYLSTWKERKLMPTLVQEMEDAGEIDILGDGLWVVCGAWYVSEKDGPGPQWIEIVRVPHGANLKVKPKKCLFAQARLQALGHVVDKDGIALDPEKICANYEAVTRPHKTGDFFLEEQERSFNALKDCLVDAAQLAYPDYGKQFDIHPDACEYGIGEALIQKTGEGVTRSLCKSSVIGYRTVKVLNHRGGVPGACSGNDKISLLYLDDDSEDRKGPPRFMLVNYEEGFNWEISPLGAVGTCVMNPKYCTKVELPLRWTPYVSLLRPRAMLQSPLTVYFAAVDQYSSTPDHSGSTNPPKLGQACGPIPKQFKVPIPAGHTFQGPLNSTCLVVSYSITSSPNNSESSSMILPYFTRKVYPASPPCNELSPMGSVVPHQVKSYCNDSYRSIKQNFAYECQKTQKTLTHYVNNSSFLKKFYTQKKLQTTMSAVIAGITHHEKQQDDKFQILEQKLTEALSELKCTNTKSGSQENDVTITATDQYEKGRPLSTENQVEKEVLVETETTAPIAETTIRQDDEIIILQDTGNLDFHLTNVLHFGTNTLIDKETTTDQTLTTTDIKHVITATNIYSNNITLATILEPLEFEKQPATSVTEEDILQKNVGQIWHTCPRFSREFIIYTDASGYGIGAVLAQIQPLPQSADVAESDGQDIRESDGVEVIIAYTSKHLNDHEAK